MLISYRSKGWTWHSPINSPRSLQRRTLQSVDEVSTTWSSATTCRLDENEEGWDEGQRSWQERPQSSEQPSNQHFSSTDLPSLEPPLPPCTLWKGKNKWGKRKILFFWCDVYVTYPVTLLVWARQKFSAESIKKPLQSFQTNTFSAQWFIVQPRTCRNLPFCDLWPGANFLMSWM